jgi:uncharacterized membrane protein YeaQ/YmgE (transglycosylase-associated protein family)
MVGALLLGFICGVIARVLMPGDVFRNMSGPTSWAVSLGLGLAGALVGYVIFTLGLGIGDTESFDWLGSSSAPSSCSAGRATSAAPTCTSLHQTGTPTNHQIRSLAAAGKLASSC